MQNEGRDVFTLSSYIRTFYFLNIVLHVPVALSVLYVIDDGASSNLKIQTPNRQSKILENTA